MTVTSIQFRSDFPEFGSATVYPDSLINFWLGVAVARLNQCAWGTLYTQGLELMTAHYVSIAGQRRKVAGVGGQPGASMGAISSKSVDKVSLGYDTALVGNEGAGQWNLTTYGTEFYELMQLIGMGGIQITGCFYPAFNFTGTDDWTNDPFWSPQP